MRINADLLNNNYNDRLQELRLSTSVIELVGLILEDINVSAQKNRYLNNRKLLVNQLEEQQLVLSKARKLFVIDKLKFDDFKELKIECQAICDGLGMELTSNGIKLKLLDQQLKAACRDFTDIFLNYLDFDIVDMKKIVSLIPPISVNIETATLSVSINNALSKILLYKKLFGRSEIIDSHDRSIYFNDRKVSIKRAITIMAKNNIQINEGEGAIILDFLYLMAKNYNFNSTKIPESLSGYRTNEKRSKNYSKLAF
ncbi:hypothetical protein HDF23_000762 [Mucilaginibacter lappiensis]|uniref:Uncharacterized protein n=2 Tax=Mucilaginibacter lappiensis TaxID=354630 RepID=A0ABR6PE39_9SPHI|nr:hypothetical protein [Mucilaginibacter lappiensis]MBB6108032.1 hypothetical protein [Mucilaginibacter lappiensis]